MNAIRFDYFDPQRDGLLGATQLQTDLAGLENLRLSFAQQKQQLTRTFSLARTMPLEFGVFCNGGELTNGEMLPRGVLRFSTLMDWFDRDFPGHYLRLIKSVKVTVIALIPPTSGIRATLRNGGISQVVVGPPYSDGFELRTIRRMPESVSLSVPFQATGPFVFDYTSDLLLPFEGSGAATDWVFELPTAANQFDYRSIADVLLTIEYTALDSNEHRTHVLQRLDRTFRSDRVFSFRHQFADAWYDLHNPEQTSTPMMVRFETRREDFPPNVTNLEINHVTLYIARKSGLTDPINVNLNFTTQGSTSSVGGSANTINGIVSTRQDNADALMMMTGSPVGEWTLALKDEPETRKLFQDELIEDILFVITFGGTAPEWPS